MFIISVTIRVEILQFCKNKTNKKTDVALQKRKIRKKL